MNQPSNFILIISIFIAFFISVIIFSVVKKIFYFFVFKKKLYILPRLSIRGISYLGMIIALSVTIIIILAIYTGDVAAILFRSFPGTRITFESILIKIGGLLLGPLLGMVLGATTDLLTIVFTAGVFHYGYFLAAIAFGLIGGFIRIIIRISGNNKKVTFFVSNILIILATLFVVAFYTFTSFSPTGGILSGADIIENLNTIALIPILNIELTVMSLMFIIIACGILTLLIFNGFYFLSWKSNHKFFKNQFITLAPIILVSFLSELLISVFLLPIVDVDLVSSINYSSWLAIRVLMLAPMFIFNTIIIWPIYKSISAIFKYDYLNDYEVDNLNIINAGSFKFNGVQSSIEIIPKMKNFKTHEKILNKYVDRLIIENKIKQEKRGYVEDEK